LKYWTFTAWLASFVCNWKHFPVYINSKVWRIAAWLSKRKQESNYGLLQSRKPLLELKNIPSGWTYSGKQWVALYEDPRHYTAVNPNQYGLPLQPLYNTYRQWFVFAPFFCVFLCFCFISIVDDIYYKVYIFSFYPSLYYYFVLNLEILSPYSHAQVHTGIYALASSVVQIRNVLP